MDLVLTSLKHLQLLQSAITGQKCQRERGSFYGCAWEGPEREALSVKKQCDSRNHSFLHVYSLVSGFVEEVREGGMNHFGVDARPAQISPARARVYFDRKNRVGRRRGTL